MRRDWQRVAFYCSISLLFSLPALAGNIALRSGAFLPCATKGIVLDGVIACMAQDKSIQAAAIEQVDRKKTETSMGTLVWFESRGKGVARVPAPSKEAKRPDPQVLSSLRNIQDRLYTREAVKDARVEQQKREEQARKDRASALRGLAPGSLGVIECLTMADEDTAVSICTRVN
ncbi:MAG TPA: hypothetical protein VGR07_09790 [Thermoanaerobaculia bacterium]|jgi:hypothetical protein|nr:hypothetical protein [Thermoanaerobaculia bacterium]